MKVTPNAKKSFFSRLRRGFTITELVIVIAVIAVLAAVLIPTFSNVIKNSKKSADAAMIKQLNTALYNDSLTNGKPEIDEYFSNCEATYVKVMTAFYNEGYTDASNMFLLACDIKQDGMYLIWYAESNTVGLVDDIEPSLFNTTYAPNFYRVNVSDSSTWGLLLSNYNSGDKGAYAKYYSGEWSSADLAQANSVWGQAVQQYEKNEDAGLTTSGANTSWAKDPANTKPGATVELQASTSQSAAKNLAGLLTVIGSGQTLQGVTVAFKSEEPVDLTGTTWTPISDAHRDSMLTASTFQGSIDFSDTVIKGLTINNDYVSASAEYQSQTDNGFEDGGYNITYGLLGALNGLESPIVIKNVTMVDCAIRLNGVTTSVKGESVDTITDSAGLIAGYAVGDITFENINIGTEGSPCYIEGYDAVGGIIGRYYGYNKKGTPEATNTRQLKITGCSVYANIYGERRAGGLVGIISNAGGNDEAKGSDIIFENTMYRGLVFCDGTRSDVAEYGVLAGGFISKSESVTINNVNIYAMVVTKNVTFSKTGSVWDPEKNLPLYSGSALLVTGSTYKLDSNEQFWTGTMSVTNLNIYSVQANSSTQQNWKTEDIRNAGNYSTFLSGITIGVTSEEPIATYTGTYTVLKTDGIIENPTRTQNESYMILLKEATA